MRRRRSMQVPFARPGQDFEAVAVPPQPGAGDQDQDAQTGARDHLALTSAYVQVGQTFSASLVVDGFPAEVSMAWLQPLTSWPGVLDVSLHLEPIPAHAAASRIRRQRVRMESSRRVQAERGALEDPLREAASQDAVDLADKVARGQSRLFFTSLVMTVHAHGRQELAEAVQDLQARASSMLLRTHVMTWRQHQGWISTLPVGADRSGARRIMDTEALATASPLSSPDLPAALPLEADGANVGADGVMVGLNLVSGAVVGLDRWSLDNHNQVVLARSGAGKSYAVKVSILRELYRGTRVAVIDPEREYLDLAERVGGTVIELGAPGVHLNPLDLPAGDPDAYTRRCLFVHTLVDVLLGEPLPPHERAVLDAAVRATYRRYGITEDPGTWTRPAPGMRELVGALNEIAQGGDPRVAMSLGSAPEAPEPEALEPVDAEPGSLGPARSEPDWSAPDWSAPAESAPTPGAPEIYEPWPDEPPLPAGGYGDQGALQGRRSEQGALQGPRSEQGGLQQNDRGEGAPVGDDRHDAGADEVTDQGAEEGAAHEGAVGEGTHGGQRPRPRRGRTRPPRAAGHLGAGHSSDGQEDFGTRPPGRASQDADPPLEASSGSAARDLHEEGPGEHSSEGAPSRLLKFEDVLVTRAQPAGSVPSPSEPGSTSKGAPSQPDLRASEPRTLPTPTPGREQAPLAPADPAPLAPTGRAPVRVLAGHGGVSGSGHGGAATAAATLAARLAPWVTGSFSALFNAPASGSPVQGQQGQQVQHLHRQPFDESAEGSSDEPWHATIADPAAAESVNLGSGQPDPHRGHLVVWSTRLLAEELRPAGMLLAVDAIWRSVDRRSADAPGVTAVGPPGEPGAAQRPGSRARQLVVVDEASLLLSEPAGVRFLARLAKTSRKRQAGLTLITPDVVDLLSSELGQVILANAASVLLLRQAPQAIRDLTRACALSPGEARFLTTARRGQALLLAVGRVPVEIVASDLEHRIAAAPPRDPHEPA